MSSVEAEVSTLVEDFAKSQREVGLFIAQNHENGSESDREMMLSNRNTKRVSLCHKVTDVVGELLGCVGVDITEREDVLLKADALKQRQHQATVLLKELENAVKDARTCAMDYNNGSRGQDPAVKPMGSEFDGDATDDPGHALDLLREWRQRSE